MISKLVLCGFAFATTVYGQSSCLEDGHADNDCCALAGHMSCSGGNRLKPTSNVCWSGTYLGVQYTAYNYACYPTNAPNGHDASKCMEDSHKDDDCCALKGHESCAAGYRVQASTHACFKNTKFTAYNYFCTPPKGTGSNNDAVCTPSKCTSPGPNGDHDCWAGNSEPYTCSGGYTPKLTGKTTPYGGKTWNEYTCCPGTSTACVTTKCTSPNGQGGYDCWAGNGEGFTCSDGFTPKMTGQTTPYQGRTWSQYECCPRPSTCSPSTCTSPNGKGGHDCWAGNGEPFTCAAGYSSKMTGNQGDYQGKTWYEYTCCKVGGDGGNTKKQCVASACREYSKENVDNDCCGVIGQTFCADGFTQSVQKNGCEKYSPQHRGTCCTKNGEHHTPSRKNDKSKCKSHGAADKNCCALPGGAACANGYKMTSTAQVCFSYQTYQAHTYTCTPPASMNGNKADPSKCRENGSFDDDCCALKGMNTCADDFDMEQSDHVCYKNTQFTAYSYSCHKPDVVVVHG